MHSIGRGGESEEIKDDVPSMRLIIGGVNAPVNGEVAAVGECRSTLGTLERLLARVDAQVGGQLIGASKRVLAAGKRNDQTPASESRNACNDEKGTRHVPHFALVRFFSGMVTPVALEVGTFAKFLVTYVAFPLHLSCESSWSGGWWGPRSLGRGAGLWHMQRLGHGHHLMHGVMVL